jgi:hypothetical protein
MAWGIGLLIAAVGLVNLALWKISLVGLSAKQIAIISFFPLTFILYYVLNGPRAGAMNE